VPKPLNSIGYNYYCTQTNDTFYKLINEPVNMGKTFYYIIDNLSVNIPTYENNIMNTAKKYFNEKVDEDLLQLWDIFITFKLAKGTVSTNDKTTQIIFEKLKEYTNIRVTNSKKLTHLVMMNEVNLNNSFVTELEINKKITKFINKLEELEKGGCLIIKVQELISPSSLHILYMLSYLFETVYIYRPEICMTWKGEKYIICENYLDKKMVYNNKNDFLMLDVEIPDNYIIELNTINKKMMQEEYIVRNKMRMFINSQNYYGDEYHDALSRQEKASDKWISTKFVLSKKDYEEIKKIENF
jgi:hypothetical protein